MPSSPLAPTVQTLPAGIEHLALPTSFPVGPINCYLLVDDPLTMVHPGMVFANSTELVPSALARHGHRISDVAHVVVTHGHPDHFGAAGWITARSDAVVVAGRPEAPKLLGVRHGDEMRALVELLGVPEHVRGSFADFYDGVRDLTRPIAASRLLLLDDGDRLRAGGRHWHAHITPGHAVGHLSLYDDTDRTLLSGDHLLACITPNPVLEPDPSSSDGRRRSLVEYLASLDRFCRLDPVTVLPGHGPPFTDVQTLTRAMRSHHLDRAGEILAVVRGAGEPTAFELAKAMFPDITGFTIMLGISEVIGHLDLLEADGTIIRTDSTPQRYRVA